MRHFSGAWCAIAHRCAPPAACLLRKTDCAPNRLLCAGSYQAATAVAATFVTAAVASPDVAAAVAAAVASAAVLAASAACAASAGVAFVAGAHLCQQWGSSIG